MSHFPGRLPIPTKLNNIRLKSNTFESLDSTASLFKSQEFVNSLNAYKESMAKAGAGDVTDPTAFFRSADFLKSLDNLPKERKENVYQSIDFLESLDFTSTDGKKLGKEIFASMDGKKNLKDVFASRDWAADHAPEVTGENVSKSVFASTDSANSANNDKRVPAAAKMPNMKDFYGSRDWPVMAQAGQMDMSSISHLFNSRDSAAGRAAHINHLFSSTDSRSRSNMNHLFSSTDSRSSRTGLDPPGVTASSSKSNSEPAKKAAAPVKKASSKNKWMQMYQDGLELAVPPAAAKAPPPAVVPPMAAMPPMTGMPPMAHMAGHMPGRLPGSLPTHLPLHLPTQLQAQMQNSMLPPHLAALRGTTTGMDPNPSSNLNNASTKQEASSANNTNNGNNVEKKPKKKRIYKSRKVIPEVKTFVDYTDDDILLGRGGLSNKHPGNKRYREEIENAKAVYRSASKDEKTEWANLLVEYMKKQGGRFLEKDKESGKWYIVPDVVARRKAGQALREDNTPESRKEKRDRYKRAHGKL